MNASKLILVILIFVLACVAWLVLGQTISARTALSEKTLRQDVDRMFGPRLAQEAPLLAVERSAEVAMRPPDESAVDVVFVHENRYRGLIWFSVYRVVFDATYTFRNDHEVEGRFRMSLPGDANIDDLLVEVGGEAVPVATTNLSIPVLLTPEAPAVVRVRYVTSGQDAWAYAPKTSDGGLRDFRLSVRTNFDEIDYPASGLSPTSVAGPRSDGLPGREAVWEYAQMLPAQNHTIGIVMPSKTDSGTLSARIARFAPVSLFFFFVIMVVIQVLKGWKLHPVNYLLIAAGFFAFHILLAYLVDHLPIHASFWIAAAVSVLLVVSYLRLVLGAKAAILVAGGAQLVYLVFFSYAFFWRGWTGLTVVIGAVVTLFVIMQLTGRIDWEEKLGARSFPRKRAEPSAAPSEARLGPIEGTEAAASSQSP